MTLLEKLKSKDHGKTHETGDFPLINQYKTEIILEEGPT
jgi:hypothetical protein